MKRIAVGVDGYPEPMVVLPAGLEWTALHRQARAMLAELRDELARREADG